MNVWTSILTLSSSGDPSESRIVSTFFFFFWGGLRSWVGETHHPPLSKSSWRQINYSTPFHMVKLFNFASRIGAFHFKRPWKLNTWGNTKQFGEQADMGNISQLFYCDDPRANYAYTVHPIIFPITATSWRARWRLYSPASRLFTQPFLEAQIVLDE